MEFLYHDIFVWEFAEQHRVAFRRMRPDLCTYESASAFSDRAIGRRLDLVRRAKLSSSIKSAPIRARLKPRRIVRRVAVVKISMATIS